MSWKSLTTAVLTSFAVLGCNMHSTFMPPPVTLAPTDAYTLDTGDRLRIIVFGQDNLSRSFTVDASGNISMTLIGTVRARGAGTRQLEQKIANALSGTYVKDPRVSVEVEVYRPFFILGEVRTPGQFSFVNGITIENAVAIAGGFTDRANERKVRVTRRIGDENVSEILAPFESVRPGDTIYVKERLF